MPSGGWGAEGSGDPGGAAARLPRGHPADGAAGQPVPLPPLLPLRRRHQPPLRRRPPASPCRRLPEPSPAAARPGMGLPRGEPQHPGEGEQKAVWAQSGSDREPDGGREGGREPGPESSTADTAQRTRGGLQNAGTGGVAGRGGVPPAHGPAPPGEKKPPPCLTVPSEERRSAGPRMAPRAATSPRQGPLRAEKAGPAVPRGGRSSAEGDYPVSNFLAAAAGKRAASGRRPGAPASPARPPSGQDRRRQYSLETQKDELKKSNGWGIEWLKLLGNTTERSQRRSAEIFKFLTQECLTLQLYFPREN